MTPTSGADQRSELAADRAAIRPFRVNVPQAELNELRRRIDATRWPERETVRDTSQGVQLATIQKLARYWATDYDWRTCEAKLKALAQFITERPRVEPANPRLPHRGGDRLGTLHPRRLGFQRPFLGVCENQFAARRRELRNGPERREVRLSREIYRHAEP